MKNVFCRLMMLAALGLSALETLEVPVLWRSPDPRSKVQSIGVLAGKDRYVFAIRLPELKEYDGRSPLMLAVYSDIDDNRGTGRFPGKFGWDFQMNIRLHQNKLFALKWNTGARKPVTIPLYSDDYLLERRGEYLYVILRREPLGELALGEKFSLRLDPVNVYLSCGTKSVGTFPPVLFAGYGNESRSRTYARDALQLERRDGLKLWNNFGERYQNTEKAPENMEQCRVFDLSGARGESEALHLTVTAEKKLNSLVLTPVPLRSKDPSRCSG